MARLIGFFSIGLISGCASVNMGDPLLDLDAKQFKAKNDVAKIYVCRNGKIPGMAIRPMIQIDGANFASIARSTYALAEVQPGIHTISVESPTHDSVMNFTAESGQIRFFQTWTVPGFAMGKAIIDEIPEADGKDCVSNGQLIVPFQD